MSPTEQIETIGDRYRLGDRLGAGGMGEVFVAHDLRLDREVALKLLRADLAQQDGMRERVVAEARLAARLTHPHVVGVLDTGEQDGRPFVVMERLSGRTLRDELAGGPMPPERVRDVGLPDRSGLLLAVGAGPGPQLHGLQLRLLLLRVLRGSGHPHGPDVDRLPRLIRPRLIC